jgi:molecular chaperone DnaK
MSDFEKKEGISLKDNSQALQRLKEVAEKAKIELSTLTETKINLPFITATETGPKHIEVTLTRDFFEELCQPLIEGCRKPVEQALTDARLKNSELDEVVLVGGSTRIPGIQNLVKSIINKFPDKIVNPDEVVAIGAAVQGGVLSGEVKNILLLDVTPLSLGVETLGGVMTKMITRNTTIPTKKSEIFSTARDNQPSVEIHVLQGEREFAKDNKSLGEFALQDIPLSARNVPKIEVTFDIDVDGILMVKAEDTSTGLEQSITIKGSSKLSDSDINQMVSEAEKFAAADKVNRELTQLKNEADSLIYKANMLLESLDKKLEINEKDIVQKLIKTRDDLTIFLTSANLEYKSLQEAINLLSNDIQILDKIVKLDKENNQEES